MLAEIGRLWGVVFEYESVPITLDAKAFLSLLFILLFYCVKGPDADLVVIASRNKDGVRTKSVIACKCKSSAEVLVSINLEESFPFG